MITGNSSSTFAYKCEGLHNIFDESELFTEAQLHTLIRRACADCNSPLSAKIIAALDNKAYDELLKTEISPSDYSDELSYFKDAQVIALVKKYPYWDITTDPRHEAMKTFIDCERQCRETNHRIWDGIENKTMSAVNSVLAIAQRKILDILGEAPDIRGIPFEFGPGATYSVKYNTSALDKLASHCDVTSGCYGLAEEFLRTCPGWNDNSQFDLVGPRRPPILRRVIGDRLSFVPKNAKTDRPIGIGPLANVLIQKGIGKCIRRKLRPYVNLRYAQFRHRDLARSASVDNDLATVDLKSASDTISYAVIQSLFPEDWFSLMDQSRSTHYHIEDRWYEYQKFSAMGNGYTFELESTLFYSLSVSVCRYMGISDVDVSVFGDDIIIPSSARPLLQQVLSYLGFTINDEKSFFEGPFRESCGGDYFNGFDVRPFYLKGRISYRTLFLMNNYLERTGYKFAFRRLFRYIRKLIGSENISYFQSPRSDIDGAIFNPSLPACSFNAVITRVSGQRRSHKMRTFGAAYYLYRIQRKSDKIDDDIDCPMFKTRKYRVKHRPYRFVHI